MRRFRIFSVNRSNSHILYEIIMSIGGINSNGTFWKISQSTAVDGILNGKWKFFIINDGVEIEVIVGNSNNRYYLKTVLDYEIPSALLKLPESI